MRLTTAPDQRNLLPDDEGLRLPTDTTIKATDVREAANLGGTSPADCVLCPNIGADLQRSQMGFPGRDALG